MWLNSFVHVITRGSAVDTWQGFPVVTPKPTLVADQHMVMMRSCMGKHQNIAS
jgi:hypothetical protein